MRISMVPMPDNRVPVPIHDHAGNIIGQEMRSEMAPVRLEINQDTEGNVVAVGLTYPRHLTHEQAVLAALAQHIASLAVDSAVPDGTPEPEAPSHVEGE